MYTGCREKIKLKETEIKCAWSVLDIAELDKIKSTENIGMSQNAMDRTGTGSHRRKD